ncbi:MAG: helix-turn-helix domain-containing protein [Actinomycetota bacterium]
MDTHSPSPAEAVSRRRELSPTEFASTVTAITSAFGDPTRRDIFLFAHASDDGVTAAETAKHFDLHANVARHHLDKLASGGYLVVETAKPSGGVGRPSKRYTTTDEQVHLEVDVRQDDILVALLGRALKMLPAEVAEQMAEEVGIEYGTAMAQTLEPGATHRSFQGALHAIADALSAHGFAARAEEATDAEGRPGDPDGDQKELQIVAEHCPFGDAVVEHPVICAVDRGIVKGMLSHMIGPNAMAEQAASLPQGDDVCVTHVSL